MLHRRSTRPAPTTAVVATVAALLAGCSAAGTGPGLTTARTDAAVREAAGATVEGTLAANVPPTTAGEEDDDARRVTVTLEGRTATVGPGGGVSVEGSAVTITAAGTYVLSGALTDGRVVVDSPDDDVVRLVLDGVDITSPGTPAIGVVDAGEVVVELADGTTSRVGDGTRGVQPAPGGGARTAALTSAVDLTITGTGELAVTGRAADGIATTGGLVLASGGLTVDAVGDGVRGASYVAVSGGTLDVVAGRHGLVSAGAREVEAGYVALTGGTTTVDVGGDGVVAETDVVVTDAEVGVTAGGGAGAADGSSTGVVSGVAAVVGGGILSVDAAGDAVASDGVVSVTGGDLDVSAGAAGVAADADLTISGGAVTVGRSEEGLGGGVVTIDDGLVDVTARGDGISVSAGAAAAEEVADGSAPGGGGGRPGRGDVLLEQQVLTVSGGTVLVEAGGDGLSSEGYAVMLGGTVVVDAPAGAGAAAIAVDGTFEVVDGTLLAVGAGAPRPPSSAAVQGWVAADLAVGQVPGTTVQVVDADDEVLATYTADEPFSSLVFSSAAVQTGTEHRLVAGGTPAGRPVGGFTAGGGAIGARTLATVVAGVQGASS